MGRFTAVIGAGSASDRQSGEIGENPSSLVAVADLLQALAQDRPYRRSLPPERCLEIMTRLAAANRLDRDLVELVARDPEACWRAAVGASAPAGPSGEA